MENQDIQRRIQIERFIPVEIFRKKVIPFEILPFSCFYRNDRNFLYHLFGLLLPCFMSRESEKFTDSKWYNSIPFLFQCQKKKYQYHSTEIFHRNLRTNVSAQYFLDPPCFNKWLFCTFLLSIFINQSYFQHTNIYQSHFKI